MLKPFHFLTSALLLAALLISSCNKTDGSGDPEQETQDDQTPSDIACIPKSVRSGIIAWYPFSNGSINDFSGNGHHLTNGTTASPAPDRAGNPSCAFGFHNFSSAGEQLFTNQSSFLNGLSQFSVSLWYMPEDTSRPGYVYESLISRDSLRGHEWSIALFDCRRAFFGRLNSVWQLATFKIDSFNCNDAVVANTGNWHHLVATFDQTLNDEMVLYRDGQLQSRVNGSAVGGNGPVSVRDVGDLILGALYNGRLDDVILYDRALSQQDVNRLFKLPACCGIQ